MIKRTLIVFAALAFASTTAIAAAPNGATLSKDKRFTSVPQGSTHYSPLQPKKGGVIFSNIGTAYPKGLYFCCYGDTISGPSSPVGGNYAVAIQFTPASDGKVKEIDAAVGWASGTNGATIALYDDNGGVPGTQLASDDVTGLGSFGGCCALAEAKIKASVTGGTPYWVVVTASGNTWDAWALNSTDQVDLLTAAYSSDGGATWSPGGALPAPGFQVLGK